MNGPEHPPGERTAAELRLHEHLEVLRQDAPQSSSLIVRRVVRSAGWQRAIRQPLLAIAALASTIGHALRLILKPPAGHP